MIRNDFRGKAVLVTGGTRGIGLATGLRFGQEGAHVYLTHKWGSADEAAIRAAFAEAGAPEPTIVEADAAADDDTVALLDTIRQRHDRLEVFVSNVAFALVTRDLSDYRLRSFLQGLGYSAWPLVGYMQHIQRTFGHHARYVVAMSSDGADTYYPGYDFVAAAKEVLEVLCRYVAADLFGQDVRVNVLRARPVSTDALRATFGDAFEPFLREHGGDDFLVRPDEVADAALALCSGRMDAVHGQVIELDRGVAFRDNLMRLFERRDQTAT